MRNIAVASKTKEKRYVQMMQETSYNLPLNQGCDHDDSQIVPGEEPACYLHIDYCICVRL
jgi:hypothetical protein